MLVNNENIITDSTLLQGSTGSPPGGVKQQTLAPEQTSTTIVKPVVVSKPTDDIVALNEMAKSSAAMSGKEMNNAIQKVDELFMQYTNRELNFEEDKETGKMVIRILDRDSGEVIRQIPPQQFLDMIANFAKMSNGLLKDLPKFV